MSEAREQILARIAAAVGGAATGSRRRRDLPARRDCSRPKNASRCSAGASASTAQKCSVYRDETGAGDHIGLRRTRRRPARRPTGPPVRPGDRADIELIDDHELAARELDRIDGALTGCTVAIAETGTIVLTASPHRRPAGALARSRPPRLRRRRTPDRRAPSGSTRRGSPTTGSNAGRSRSSPAHQPPRTSNSAASKAYTAPRPRRPRRRGTATNASTAR